MRFVRIASVTSPTFGAAMALYVEAFPANERHAVEVIAQRTAEGFYEMHVGLVDEELALFALVHPLAGSPFVVLDYLATATAFRGQGVATTFMHKLTRELAPDKHIVVEAEDPAHGTNRAERRRRVDFYTRLGGRVLPGINYILPAPNGGEPTEMVLILMGAMLPQEIAGQTLRALIIRLYRELYNRPADDPLLLSFIGDVKDAPYMLGGF